MTRRWSQGGRPKRGRGSQHRGAEALKVYKVKLIASLKAGKPRKGDSTVRSPSDGFSTDSSLVHEAATEVGTRFTLRKGGKTSKHLYLVSLTHDPHGRSQLELGLSQSSFGQLKLRVRLVHSSSSIGDSCTSTM